MSFTLCSNQLYLHNHYLLYFYPAFITSAIVFIVMNIIIIIITIISMCNIIGDELLLNFGAKLQNCHGNPPVRLSVKMAKKF